MRKWLGVGIAIVVALSLVIGILSPAVVSAKEKGAADTVTAFVKALPNLKKTAVTAGYWVTGQQASVKGKLDAIPKDTKITTKLVGKLKTTGQDGGPATVVGTYKIDLQLKKQKQSLGQKMITFTLEKKGDPKKFPWLISDCDLDLKSLSIGTTVTSTATPTTVSSGPVKIGDINSFSGPAAISGLSLNDPIIKLVEKQVKDEGGILGGREVQVVRYDNRASVAEAQAGVKKLYYDDKVSAITVGGVSGAEFNAVAATCEELKILYSALAHVEDLAKYKFTVDATVQREQQRELSIKFINKVLKPKTAAFFGTDDAQAHSNMQGAKEGLEAAGTKTVYMEYCPITTTDFSPYLTKIKYEKPDLLYLYSGSNEFYITIAKQIMELGGWGDIKVFTQASGESAKKQAGAQGWYMNAYWALGLNNPGAVKFEKDFQAMYGREPSANQVLYYNSLWTAIYAIKLAGTDTDRVAIAQAARSGKLEWDTPMGHAKFTPDGNSGLNCIIKQVVNGDTVVVPFP